MSRLNADQIDCCRRIGRDEVNRRTTMGLAELDALCDTALLGARGRREHMPDERQSLTHKFKIHAGDGEYRGYITVGLYADGRPGELFVKIEVPGEPSAARGDRQQLLNALLDGVGIATSIALQNGAELRTIVDKYIAQQFEPRGRTEHAQIARCTSVLDYVFRWLGVRFLSLDYAIVRE